MPTAVYCDRFVNPPEFRIAPVDRHPLKATAVRVAVKACGVNFPDFLMTSGGYQKKPPTPFIPGFECAGEVIEIGSDVTKIQQGDRVAVLRPLVAGCMASEIVADQADTYLIPKRMPFTEASGFLVTAGTAYYALQHLAQLRPGEKVLVSGGAGGVGLAATQIAAAAGGFVVAVDRGSHRLASARAHGATLALEAGELTKDHLNDLGLVGFDVFVDLVGGQVFETGIRFMNVVGRALVIGFASGSIPSIATNYLLLKEFCVIGVNYGSFTGRDPKSNRGIVTNCFRLWEAGKMKSAPLEVRPIEEVADALASLGEGRARGKIVLSFSD